MALTLRLTKGSPLTHQELDDNFSHNSSSIAAIIAATGSFLYSGSFDGSSTLTLYSGDTNYSIDLSALSGGGGSTDISALNTFTGSIQIEVDSLTAATSSYLTADDTGSFVYSGSYNSSTNTITLYSIDGNYDLDISDLVGGSTDITALNAHTASINTYTGSLVSFLDDREFAFWDDSLKVFRGTHVRVHYANGGYAKGVNIGYLNSTNNGFTIYETSNDPGGQGEDHILMSDSSGSDIIIRNAGEDAGNGYIFIKSDEPGASGEVVTVARFGGDEKSAYLYHSGSNVFRTEFISNEASIIVSGSISGSKDVFFPGLPNTTTANIVGFDTATGQLSYYGTSSFGGGSPTDISALNTFTGSIQTEVDSLTAATSSYVTNDETGSFLYSGSYNSATNAITLYSINQDYDLDLSGLAGGAGGFAITASDEGVVKTENARSFDFAGNGVIATNSGNAVTVTITQVDTGSLLTTGSVDNNILTFTKGDGTTFELTVETGSSVDISALNLHTGSINTFTGSINTFTGSIQTEVDNLTAATSSYVTNDETGSFLYSGSYNGNTSTITLYSIDQNYTLDLSGLSGGGGSGLALTASDEGSVLSEDVRSLDFVGNGVVATNSGNAVTVTITQVDTGSLMVTGSVTNNVLTFDKGDGTAFSLTVDTGSAPGNDSEVIYNKNGDFHATASFTFNDNGASGQELIIDGTKVNENALLKISGSDSSYLNIGESLIYNNVSSNFTSINHTFLGSGNTLSWETDDNNEGPQWVLGDRLPNQNTTTGSNFTIIPGYTNDRDALFRVYRTPSLNNWVEAFSVSSSGQVYMPELENTTTPHIVGYNITTGELTYYETGSFGSGGGSTDISALNLHTGSINTFTGSIQTEVDNLTAATSSYLTADDTGSFLTTGSVNNTTLTFTKGDGTTFDLTVTGSNIFNTDGTLISDRTVAANGNSLTFEFQDANFIINSDAARQVQINNLDAADTPQVIGYTGGILKAMPTSSFKPGGPVNTFQFNKNNNFSGSSVFFDSVDEFVGIGESSPDRPLHITDTDAVAIKLERTDAPEVGIQFFGNGASGGGAIIRGLNNDFEVIQRDTATSANERNLFISASGEVYAPRLNIKSTKNLVYYDDSNGEILQHRDVLDKIAAPTGSVQYTTGGASATTSSFVTVAGTIRTTTGETSHASEALSHLNGKTLGTDAFITATWADTSEASNQEQFCVLASISGSGQLVVETSTVNTGRSDAIIFQGVVLI